MNMVLTPRVSEKAYGQSGTLNTYVFNVPLDSNKIEIKKVVEATYEVTVKEVNIVRQAGKTKKTYKKGGKATVGKRSDYKKAYVTITEGQSIPVFAAQEEGETK